jgi:hypothetical protein
MSPVRRLNCKILETLLEAGLGAVGEENAPCGAAVAEDNRDWRWRLSRASKEDVLVPFKWAELYQRGLTFRLLVALLFFPDVAGRQ